MSDSIYVNDVGATDFDANVKELSYSVPVLVDFWAEWCAPCRMLGPMLEKLAEEYQGAFQMAKVDADKEQALSMKYSVRNLPTVIMFRNGEVVDQFMGAQPERVLREFIERHTSA